MKSSLAQRSYQSENPQVKAPASVVDSRPYERVTNAVNPPLLLPLLPVGPRRHSHYVINARDNVFEVLREFRTGLRKR